MILWKLNLWRAIFRKRPFTSRSKEPLKASSFASAQLNMKGTYGSAVSHKSTVAGFSNNVSLAARQHRRFQVRLPANTDKS